jgi:hypothetical protein
VLADDAPGASDLGIKVDLQHDTLPIRPAAMAEG